MNQPTIVYDSEEKTNSPLQNRFLESVKPLCLKCNKPVEKIECLYIPVKNSNLFIASCHGSQESVEMTHSATAFSSIQAGYAFAEPLLERLK